MTNKTEISIGTKPAFRFVASVLSGWMCTLAACTVLFLVSKWGMERAVAMHPLQSGLAMSEMTEQVVAGGPYMLLFWLIFPLALIGGPVLCFSFDRLISDRATRKAGLAYEGTGNHGD